MRALRCLPWALALLALLVSAGLAAADNAPCSGHGEVDEKGLCACDTPWPEAGAKGYTGSNCSVPVFGVAAPDGRDLAAGCAADGCSSLESGQWVCFAAHFPWSWK